MDKLNKALNIRESVLKLDVEIKQLKDFLDFAVQNDVDQKMQFSIPNVSILKKPPTVNFMHFDMDSEDNQNVDVLDKLKNSLNDFRDQLGDIKKQGKPQFDFILSSSEIILATNVLYEYRLNIRKQLVNEFKQLELNLTL